MRCGVITDNYPGFTPKILKEEFILITWARIFKISYDILFLVSHVYDIVKLMWYLQKDKTKVLYRKWSKFLLYLRVVQGTRN